MILSILADLLLDYAISIAVNYGGPIFSAFPTVYKPLTIVQRLSQIVTAFTLPRDLDDDDDDDAYDA